MNSLSLLKPNLFLFILLGFLIIAPDLRASHIAGGDIVVRYKDETAALDDYQLILRLFRDRGGINMSSSHSVSSFRKNNPGADTRIDCWTLSCAPESSPCTGPGITLEWPLDNPACAALVIGTATGKYNIGLYIYQTDVTLSTAQYGDIASPNGVYFAWSECCRNDLMDNTPNPSSQTGALVTEYGPTVRNGVRMENSSPFLSVPYGDYACIGYLFSQPWGDTIRVRTGNVPTFGAPVNPALGANPRYDRDGDTVVYILTNPLNATAGGSCAGSGTPGNWPQTPTIYTPMAWSAGYNINIQTPRFQNVVGNEFLPNPDGTVLMTVGGNPSSDYITAIKAIEMRKNPGTGKWDTMGVVLREYQFHTEPCTPSDPPIDSLFVDPTVSNAKLCDTCALAGPRTKVFDIYSLVNADARTKKIGVDTIRIGQSTGKPGKSTLQLDIDSISLVYPYGVKYWLSRADGSILPEGQSFDILGATDTVFLNVTWDPCSFSAYDTNGKEIPVVYRIRRFSDGCPRPFADTIYYNIYLNKPENRLPEFTWVNDSLTVDKSFKVDTAIANFIPIDTLFANYKYFGFDVNPSDQLVLKDSATIAEEVKKHDVFLTYFLKDLDNDTLLVQPLITTTNGTLVLSSKMLIDTLLLDTLKNRPNDTIDNGFTKQSLRFSLNCQDINSLLGKPRNPIYRGAIDSLSRNLSYSFDIFYTDKQPTDYLYTDSVSLVYDSDSCATDTVELTKSPKCICRPPDKLRRVVVDLGFDKGDTAALYGYYSTDIIDTTFSAFSKGAPFNASVNVNDTLRAVLYGVDSSYKDIVTFNVEFAELLVSIAREIDTAQYFGDIRRLGGDTTTEGVIVNTYGIKLTATTLIESIFGKRLQVIESSNLDSLLITYVPACEDLDLFPYEDKTFEIKFNYYEGACFATLTDTVKAIIKIIEPDFAVNQVSYITGLGGFGEEDMNRTKHFETEVQVNDSLNLTYYGKDDLYDLVSFNLKNVYIVAKLVNQLDTISFGGSVKLLSIDTINSKTAYTYEMLADDSVLLSQFFGKRLDIDTIKGGKELMLTFMPQCEDYNGFADPDVKFELVYSYYVEGCLMEDTLKSYIKIKGPDGHFPNVVTANGDGLNDVLRLGQPNQVMPLDCDYKFQNIIVYNRWGQEIHRDEIREFEYAPPSDLPSGVYFYVINYEGNEPIKGWFQLMK